MAAVARRARAGAVPRQGGGGDAVPPAAAAGALPILNAERENKAAAPQGGGEQQQAPVGDGAGAEAAEEEDDPDALAMDDEDEKVQGYSTGDWVRFRRAGGAWHEGLIEAVPRGRPLLRENGWTLLDKILCKVIGPARGALSHWDEIEPMHGADKFLLCRSCFKKSLDCSGKQHCPCCGTMVWRGKTERDIEIPDATMYTEWVQISPVPDNATESDIENMLLNDGRKYGSVLIPRKPLVGNINPHAFVRFETVQQAHDFKMKYDFRKLDWREFVPGAQSKSDYMYVQQRK
eukprot:gene1670-19681_t